MDIKRFLTISLISSLPFLPGCKEYKEKPPLPSSDYVQNQPIQPDHAHIGILLEEPSNYSSRENPGLSEATIKPNQLVYLSLFYDDKDGVTWNGNPESREERIYLDERLALNGISHIVASPGFKANDHQPMKFHTEGMTLGEHIIRYEVEDAKGNINIGLAKIVIRDP